MSVGITERGDAGLHLKEWIKAAEMYNVDFTIAITKAPSILLANIEILPKNLIIHATITGWGGSSIEPNVRNWQEEMTAYKGLVQKLGPERVVLRIDPIFPTEEGVHGALYLASHCEGRLRISILDYYLHVQDRFEAVSNPMSLALTPLYNTNTFLKKELRGKILALFPTAEICGELGFLSTGCVSVKDYQVLGIKPPQKTNTSGQRSTCSCLSEKKELLTHMKQCAHGCLYCYWR